MLKLLHALLHEILLWWKIGSQAPPKLQPLSGLSPRCIKFGSHMYFT